MLSFYDFCPVHVHELILLNQLLQWVDEDEQDEQEPDAGAEAPGAPGGLDLSQLAAMQGLDPSALQGLDPSALSKGGDDEGDDEEDEGDEVCVFAGRAQSTDN